MTVNLDLNVTCLFLSVCLLEQCDGLEVCRASVVQSLLGEPCPIHGSYLSVQYHCDDGQSAPICLPLTLRI